MSRSTRDGELADEVAAAKSASVAQLLFKAARLLNVHAVPGLMSPWILRMVGAWKRLAQSRIWRSMVKDRAAASASARRVMDLEFRRLVPAHGEVIDGADTRERVGLALRWMLG